MQPRTMRLPWTTTATRRNYEAAGIRRRGDDDDDLPRLFGLVSFRDWSDVLYRVYFWLAPLMGLLAGAGFVGRGGERGSCAADGCDHRKHGPAWMPGTPARCGGGECSSRRRRHAGGRRPGWRGRRRPPRVGMRSTAMPSRGRSRDPPDGVSLSPESWRVGLPLDREREVSAPSVDGSVILLTMLATGGMRGARRAVLVAVLFAVLVVRWGEARHPGPSSSSHEPWHPADVVPIGGQRDVHRLPTGTPCEGREGLARRRLRGKTSVDDLSAREAKRARLCDVGQAPESARCNLASEEQQPAPPAVLGQRSTADDQSAWEASQLREVVNDAVDWAPRLVDVAHMGTVVPNDAAMNGEAGIWCEAVLGSCAACGAALGSQVREWRICVCRASTCLACMAVPCRGCGRGWGTCDGQASGLPADGAGEGRPAVERQHDAGAASIEPVAPRAGDDTRGAMQANEAHHAQPEQGRGGQRGQHTRKRARRNANRVWSVLSCNGSGCGPLQDVVAAVPREDNTMAVFGQEHRKRGSGARQLEDWAHGHGWSMAAADANVTASGDTSGGAFVAVRRHLTMGRWPGAKNSCLAPGRVAGSFLKSWVKGGIGLASAYFLCSKGLCAENRDLMNKITSWVRELDGPFILAGDWQMHPSVLVESGWLDVLGAIVVAPDEPTCGEALLDYFIIDKRLAAFVDKVEVVEVGTRPHKAVRRTLKGTLRGEMARQLRRQKPLPTQRAIGCALRPPEGRQAVADALRPPSASDGDATNKWKILCEYIEKAVAAVAGVGGSEAEAMRGRGDGPKWVWTAAQGRPATGGQRTSAKGRQAKAAAGIATDLLRALRMQQPVAVKANLKRLRACRKDALGDELNWVRDVLCQHVTIESLERIKVECARIAQSEEEKAAAARKADWEQWVKCAMRKGARKAHRWVKGPTGWRPPVDEHGNTMGPQQRAETQADTWGRHWDASEYKLVPAAHPWPSAGRGALSRPSLKRVREVCRSVPEWTGLGVDGPHPRALDLLCDEDLALCIDMLMDIENTGFVPMQLDYITEVFIPLA